MAAAESAALDRELAAQRPDAFRPDLAVSLNNLANRLGALDRHEAALAAAEESVALYRELAAQRPNAFRPNLAGSLGNLASMLGDLGRREAALAVAEEAVAHWAPAFVQQPAAFGGWMVPILQKYLQYCENLRRPLDTALVEPILAILQKQST